MKIWKRNCKILKHLLISLFFISICNKSLFSNELIYEIRGNNFTDSDVILSLLSKIPDEVNEEYTNDIIKKLNQSNIRTSLFINPSIKDIKMAKQLNSNCIEIHTGKLANLVKKRKNFTKEYVKIKNCVKYANSLKLEIHAGHGLDYKTTKILKKITNIKEYNIGHFIIGESIFNGFKKTIHKFKKILK